MCSRSRCTRASGRRCELHDVVDESRHHGIALGPDQDEHQPVGYMSARGSAEPKRAGSAQARSGVQMQTDPPESHDGPCAPRLPDPPHDERGDDSADHLRRGEDPDADLGKLQALKPVNYIEGSGATGDAEKKADDEGLLEVGVHSNDLPEASEIGGPGQRTPDLRVRLFPEEEEAEIGKGVEDAAQEEEESIAPRGREGRGRRG